MGGRGEEEGVHTSTPLNSVKEDFLVLYGASKKNYGYYSWSMSPS